MIRWEYKFARMTADDEESIKELNELGEEGWELVYLHWIEGGFPHRERVSDSADASYGVAYLKRSVEMPSVELVLSEDMLAGSLCLDVMSDEERQRLEEDVKSGEYHRSLHARMSGEDDTP